MIVPIAESTLAGMVTVKAHVQAGRLVVDEPIDLPDGSEVELAPVVNDDLDEKSRAALEAALARSATQISRGELIDASEVLARLGVNRT